MSDVIHQLYQEQVYPPMSHPLSDPAMSAVAARIGGLDVKHPRGARILEIGCCSGHNLIPLAMRWPESDFIGIDLAERSIDEANERAVAAGVTNVVFHAADLTTYEPEGGPFDFIIAHGFFSWVPDAVKAALLVFCRRHLAPSGIATVSFNLESGWKPRRPVIAKVRAIQQAGGGDLVSCLLLLKELTPAGNPEAAIIDDMLAKGPAILAFDDFGPVNDAWPLDRFAQAAANAGLRWLGETDPGGNIPSNLGAETLAKLEARATDPLDFQMAVDEAAGRTFRSGVLCREDAPIAPRVPSGLMLDLAVRASHPPDDPEEIELFQVIDSFAPACVEMEEVLHCLPGRDGKWIARQLFTGITRGWVSPRIESLHYDPEPPAFPGLDAFRLLCARNHLPLVDAWHKPCAFPTAHYQVLAAMDGGRSIEELAAFSKTRCPELAFAPWLSHLARRGMFA
ncbi:methyltransferase domain-containing protein [Luteolibacter yonseiensis]|uniref:Methyltransferase domain-containing protein n=1 Tax=Luteolibacter yonseiensis TaxID=1144680 RepID=A0A934R4Q8_9BACT|nr:class I SAM-dependent methyltransferase [Luteolibacter yonseiensis]MBK1816899.1 methyltransferase domain-containing protein [Luteolibacter yonseiensis]